MWVDDSGDYVVLSRPKSSKERPSSSRNPSARRRAQGPAFSFGEFGKSSLSKRPASAPALRKRRRAASPKEACLEICVALHFQNQ